MSDMQTFPETVDEFMEYYKVIDKEGVYMSKGVELVPIFRMKQWFEHSERKRGKWISEYTGKPVKVIKGFPQESCECSVCGKWLIASDEYGVIGNYCPNCGARMERTDETD